MSFTVFTLDKAREISAAAVKTGRVQSVLLKVYSDDDFLYPGQESGFVQHSLHEVVAEIQNLPGLHLAGLTHFPCLLWDEAAGKDFADTESSHAGTSTGSTGEIWYCD